MATQSLYRRYRPRRFGDVKGQQHVVRALRDAVAAGREGQAYLFSGPRGTGKTTTARILAKVLNCDNVVDGEPCCECESCRAVETGTSYDVHELDAASNNGVDAIRDLIEKASLGTPGRHKVYILDEVHMLSKGAEAALLKTLEEPPPHVVFVLATTDPQKMSDTIRSRTQHLQFHLLPADELSEHVRWVAADAELDVTDEALEAALTRGGGSARDTLSALELLVATGGDVGDSADLDGFVQALIDRDAGAALSTMAAAVSMGLDPRAITEDLVRHLRNSFLALMAPDLVVVAPDRLGELTERARTLGAASIVGAIERLGGTLTDMRNAPDPRVLVEVALVQLSRPDAGGGTSDVGALEARLADLERRVADGAPSAVPAAPATAGAAEPTTQAAPPTTTHAPAGDDVGSGRKVLGGAAQAAKAAAERARANAKRDPGRPTRQTPAAPTEQPARQPSPTPTDEPAAPAAVAPAAEASASAVADAATAMTDGAPVDATPASSDAPAATPETPAPAAPAGTSSIDGAWDDQVKGSLPPMVRALYAAGTLEPHGSIARFVVPTEIQVTKCAEHRRVVEQALTAAVGSPVTVEIVTDSPSTAASPSTPTKPVGGPLSKAPAAPGHSHLTDDDESDIDPDDLRDVPPSEVKTPIDQLAEAFPGSEYIEE